MILDRTIRPAASDNINFDIPAINSFTLDNGIKVLFVERHNLPIIRLNLVVQGGSNLDKEGKKGIASLFTMMLDEGAGTYSAMQLSDEFEMLGSNFESSCTDDAIFLSIRSLTENFDKTLNLFNTIISAPHLKKEDFEREKRKTLVRILQQKDDSEDIANNVFSLKLFPKNHPYALPTAGLEETVTEINIEDIKEYYSNNFNYDKATVIVVGDISYKDTLESLNRTIGKWITKKTPDFTFFEPAEETDPAIYLINKPGAMHSDIRIGYLSEKRNESTYFPKLLLNMILGGQFSSRINLNLRENKGYTYGAFSSFNYYKEAGFFIVSSSVNAGNTADSLVEISFELNRIKDGININELNFAKSSLIRRFPSGFETNRQIAASLTRMIMFSLPFDYFNTYLSRIKAITMEDIKSAADFYIQPDKCFTVIVGDKNSIIAQLDGKGLNNLIELDYKGNKIL
jgi:zinc protease